ncbi:DNA primase [Sinanaerobacter sp. ZZT-01]|uniref:DNA primase n=1 Tax=Sinanaerobacter sp. ZZT-01 TaxID=3111540 RepID=UPI002D78F2BE|nr:DNA primase [Sinanaerobacter sp. ZZT-01]WRR95115.1 DNA primase [Sinanaerobacter sp. ZZT-01]
MTIHSKSGVVSELSAGFQENVIEEIKSRCSIVDVIGRHVVLKKAGSNYKGVCPFHNEKTPSFVVSDAKQIFTCFGCGASGDVIEFVKRYHNLDFQGAVEKLAAEYGIELKKNQYDKESKKAIYYDINREAASFFYRSFTRTANPGIEYMKKRGMDAGTLKKFGIGYADEKWDSLYRHFMEKGTDIKLLLELGLISQSKGRYYDKFRNRVMFPIINTRGKVIGFGGRAIADQTPKYLNSPESPVFLKKNNLYGLNSARQDINKEDYAILVEGYMDVISLYKSGIKNVAASLGTALTESQASMLKRYTDHIILSYDADEAGQAATLRGMDILHRMGCKVKVLHIPDGKDPDEFIKKNGKDAFLQLVKKALPFASYKIQKLRQKYDLQSTEESVIFLQETAKFLRQLSPVETDVYIKKIANETHISEGAIRLEVYGSNMEHLNPKTREMSQPEHETDKKSIKKMDGSKLLLEKSLIKLMLLKSSYVPRIKPYETIFQNPFCMRIYGLIQSLYKDDEEIDRKKLADALEPAEYQMLRSIWKDVYLADRDEDVFTDCISHIEDGFRHKREQEIIQILSLSDEDMDSSVIEQLTRELMEIQKQKVQR